VEHQSIEQRLVQLSGRGDLKIPPYPAVLARVTRIVGRHDYTIPELAKAVQSDPALTAAVLRYANSPRHAPPSPISSLERGITHIGAKELVRCAIAGSLGQAATGPGPLATVRYRVWREAVLGANLSQELAIMRGMPGDLAFLAGLLHDFGKIVLLAALDQTLQTGPAMTATRWIGIVESSHVEAGVRAAREWRLPPPVVDVIAAHHGGKCEPAHRTLVDLVRTVDAIVAVCSSHSALADEDISSIPGLARGEAQRIVAALPAIFEMVASFSHPSRPSAPSGSLVIPEASEEPGAKVDFAVSCERKDEAVVFAAKNVSWDSMRVQGRQTLSENCLVKITLHLSEGDLPVWMTVVEASREGADYLIHFRPYAMHGAAKTAYHSMVTHAMRSAQ
jgi:putative nucleotidyltransferase with HDIG domain